MRAINVWAWQEQLTNPGEFQRDPICSDASASTRRMGPGGSWVAGAGWHFAFPFSSLADLATKLRTLMLPDYIRGDARTMQRGEVQTLALDCHGIDGVFYPSGVSAGTGVHSENLDNHGTALRNIGLMTASRPYDALVPNPPSPFMRQERVGPSTIIIMACNTAAGSDGTELLEQLSYRWPNRKVVSFSTTIIMPRLHLVEDVDGGEACAAPFFMDSGRHNMPRSEHEAWTEEFRRQYGDRPQPLPFADATAANAKIAQDGRIIDWPANEPPGRRAVPGRQQNGPPRGNAARPTRGRPHARRAQ